MFQHLKRKTGGGGDPGVNAVPAAYLNLPAEIALAVTHACHAVVMQYCHVPECAPARKESLNNGGSLPDNVRLLPGDFSDDAGCQGRTLEWVGSPLWLLRKT